jgi:hypothetical protein
MRVLVGYREIRSSCDLNDDLLDLRTDDAAEGVAAER